jgi:uncharacterized protein with PQ loop repeat
MLGFHHVRARARGTEDLEPFPSENARKRFLDYLMYGVGIIAPIALLPQIIQLYTTKSSAGISLLTWFFLALINTLWAIYAMAHKDKQLLFASIFMALFDLIIVVGILLY